MKAASPFMERLRVLATENGCPLSRRGEDIVLEVAGERFLETMRALRDDEELRFDYFSFMTGTDDGRSLLLDYLLRSFENEATLDVRLRLSRDGAAVPSVTELWAGADWYERECAEMLGVQFSGHPDPRPLLLPEGFPGHPLRRDFSGEVDKLWLVKRMKRLK